MSDAGSDQLPDSTDILLLLSEASIDELLGALDLSLESSRSPNDVRRGQIFMHRGRSSVVNRLARNRVPGVLEELRKRVDKSDMAPSALAELDGDINELMLTITGHYAPSKYDLIDLYRLGQAIATQLERKVRPNPKITNLAKEPGTGSRSVEVQEGGSEQSAASDVKVLIGASVSNLLK